VKSPCTLSISSAAGRERFQLRSPRDPDDVGPGARETGPEIPSRPANTVDRDAQSAADRGFRYVAGLTHPSVHFDEWRRHRPSFAPERAH
jgi:hypothetical protein